VTGDNEFVSTPPADRDRFVDALRVFGVLIVVLGHWAVMMVYWEDDRILGINALEVIPALRLVTWVVQVMPLMFFIGGFANATTYRLRDGSASAFLRDRLLRLLTPTVVFIGVWFATGIVIEGFELGSADALHRAADVAALPFWFLGIYLVAVGLTPAMMRLHERFAWRVPLVLGLGVVAVDIVARGVGVSDLGNVNYALVWLLAHQTGFFYADGTLQRLGRPIHAAMAAVGLAGMIGLVTIGTYPVSMVEVPGEPVSNTAPPSIGLVFLTLWLVGLALLARPTLNRWLKGRTWGLVTRLNRVPLTLYLWHVTAITVAVSILYPLDFPQPEIGTTQWWALRPAWVAAMVPVLVVLVGVFRRCEVHPYTDPRPGPFGGVRVVGAIFGIFVLAVAVLGFGRTGFIDLVDPLGDSLLMFRLNPVQNLFHLVLGCAVMAGVLVWRRWSAWITMAGAALFLAAGLWDSGSAETSFGMNPTTGITHVAVGGAALVGVVILGAVRANGGPQSSGV
jgi:fucose 4-O-acetylase-like acetyltransferase